MKKFILCLFVAVCVSFAYGEIVNLSNLPITSSTHPWVIASEGKVMVVWREEGGHSGTDKNIYYAIYKNGKWTTPKACYCTGVTSKNPHIALSPEGIVHLVWADGNASDREIFHGIFQDGAWQGAPEKVLASPFNSNWAKVVITDSGKIETIWASAMTSGISEHWIIRYNWKRLAWGSGRILSTNLVDTGETNLAMFPQAVHRNGITYVIWPERDPAGSQIMFTERIDGAWIEPIPITGKKTYTWPGMAVDSQGDVHVIASKTGGKVWYTRRHAGRWSIIEPVNQNTTHQRGFTCLAVDKFDGLHAVYQVEKFIYYSYKPAGEGWQDEIKISDGPGEGDRFPAIDVDLDGYVHIVWCSGDEGLPSDIFYRRILLKEYFPESPDFIEPPHELPIDPTDDPPAIEPSPPEPTPDPPATPPAPEPVKKTLWDYIQSHISEASFGYCLEWTDDNKIELATPYVRLPFVIFSKKLDLSLNCTSDSRLGFAMGVHLENVGFDVGLAWKLRKEFQWRPSILIGFNKLIKNKK